MFRKHYSLFCHYPDWTLRDTATLLNIPDAEMATLIASAKAIYEQALPVRTHSSYTDAILKFKRIVEHALGTHPTPVDTHHVHFLCPRDLWRRFRGHFPGYGEVGLRLIEALTMYVNVMDKIEKEKQ